MTQQEILRFKTNLNERLTTVKLYPTNKIYIWNWKILFTTNKMIGRNSWREFIIWYSFDNYWNIHLRQFYKSMSEWCWRACPGMRDDWCYSKWELITDSSYETTTKVDFDIWNAFDLLHENYYNDFYPYGNNSTYNPISYIANTYNKNNILSDDIWPQDIYIRNLFPNLVSYYDNGTRKCNATDFYDWTKWHNIQEVIEWYNKLIPDWLDYKHMKINPNKSYSYQHKYLWEVNVQVCIIKRNWIDLDFYFARAINSPDKVWIENVVSSDAQINNWWIYDKQINAWPLVAKPVDYADHCPNWQIDQILPKVSEQYRDIRELYQWNPIIKKFKKISK